MKEPTDPGIPADRGSWVEQQLGEGWTTVEPGIYRFTGKPNEFGIRMAPPQEDPPSAE